MADQEEAVRRARARSSLYSLLSVLFLYPEDGSFSGLSWEEAREAVAILGGSGRLQEAVEAVRDALADPSDLGSEHARVFGHTIQSDCPPYETQYGGQYRGLNSQLGGAQIFEQSHTLADIAGFYRAFGLDVSDRARERVDHVSVELEFMAFLAYKEGHALSSDAEEKVEICRAAQKKFLSDHLCRWVPAFARRLGTEAGDGLYRRLACLAEGFVAFEVEALGVEPVAVDMSALVPFEPEGNCSSCGIGDLDGPGEGSSCGKLSSG